MRIQHNIMAMNAYRNYTNNVSAMKANLEKLSSGYKINRAGDDAAGLAISEKMRAQITGLETAQKNAKDGISLVQTAEGALTEVHDMLNRMVELATQSANGTYDNDTDRAQLQKEVNQLRSEIDRIADSSNFNGIKLLDGSLSGREASTEVKVTTEPGALTSLKEGSELPGVGTTLGVDTVLHVDKGAQDGGTQFTVALHNVGFTNTKGATMGIQIGDTQILITGTGGTILKDTDLAQYIVDQINGGGGTNVKVSGAAPVDGVFQIEGQDFKVEVGSDGKSLVFKQVSAPSADSEVVDGYMNVTVTGSSRSDTLEGSYKISGAHAASAAAVTLTLTDNNTTKTSFATSAVITAANVNSAISFKFDIKDSNGNDVSKTYTLGTANTDSIKVTVDGDKVYLANDPNKTALTTDKVRSLLQDLVNKDIDAANKATAAASDALVIAGAEPSMVQGIGHVTLAAADFDTPAGKAVATVANDPTMYYKATGANTADYNVQTSSVQNVTLDKAPRLASTIFDLTKDMVKEGNSLKIGKQEYIFTTDETLKNETGFVFIGDLVADGSDAVTSDENLAKAANRLATAASDNTTYTVGSQSGQKSISVTEIEGQTDYAENGKSTLTTKEAIEDSLGLRTGTKYSSETIETPAGKKLTLQIGDTADSYNQLKVSIGDTHAAALGLGDISIADQDDAAKAVEAIKTAINTVSDIRGTLGATQNRLDHTINNLSVMTENIQDAESTIRDTDVAEEMMAYTKNNILIQSAQAMLAQANQVPQGVLQLLQ